MSNLVNSEKEKIVKLVKTWRNRSGLSIEQIVARMQANGIEISRTQFENRLTTRLEQKPNISLEWVLALVQVFTKNLYEHERCRMEETLVG